MLTKIKTVFTQHAAKLAFCIGKQSYSYAEWLRYVSGIRKMLSETRPSSHFVGLAAYDDIETYAAILALWAEGYAFVPLSPQSPAGRNAGVLQQVDSTCILSSRGANDQLVNNPEMLWLSTADLQAEGEPPNFSKLDADQILCMLFTSGSTGAPKGVPYTCKNITTTLDAFFALGYDLNSEDRFLQMFELTFDMSMLSYLPAWCIGASVHTVNSEGIKYLNAFKVMQEQAVSFAAMVPSTVQLLQPYFLQIKLPAIRYCLLGGEPFYTDLAEAWMDCLPNAQVVNISGPCETTMACMGYNLDRTFPNNKSHKNILAFGSPWKNTTVLLLKANGETAQTGEEGELCFGGDHVMQGYWQMPEKNASLFFERSIDGKMIQFYRSGDMAFQDEEGTFYSCGRKDIQYKIQGYKVELGDIEQHARHFMQKGNAVAHVSRNEKELLEIHLFIDQPNTDIAALSAYLQKELPIYIQPRSIRKLKQLPLTISGKADRGQLARIFEGDDFDWITTEDMTHRVEDNFYSTYRAVANCTSIAIWQEGGVEAIDTSPSNWPRTAFGTPEVDQLDQLVDNMRKGQIPSRLILKRPIHPEVLYHQLDQFGFQYKVSWSGMAIDLLNNIFSKEENSVSLIQSEEELKQWLHLVNNVLFVNANLDWLAVKTLWESGIFSFYGLSVKGQMEATIMGHKEGNSLGIYMVGVVETHRRKGFGKALTLHILQDAKEQGCRVAYLQATAMGRHLYEKIGFEAFCDFDIFGLVGADK